MQPVSSRHPPRPRQSSCHRRSASCCSDTSGSHVRFPSAKTCCFADINIDVLDVLVSDSHHIEVVASGLPMWQGAQLATAHYNIWGHRSAVGFAIDFEGEKACSEGAGSRERYAHGGTQKA